MLFPNMWAWSAGLALAPALALALGCGGKNKGLEHGTVDFTLVNEGVDAHIRSVALQISGVEAQKLDGTWNTVDLGAPFRTVDLMDESAPALVSGAALPVGSYQAFRFHLGAGNSVTTSDGVRHALAAPGAFLAVPGVSFFDGKVLNLGKGRGTRVAFLFHAAHLIRKDGFDATYKLWGHEVTWREDPGTLTGKVVLEDGTPAVGAEVTAQIQEEPASHGIRHTVVRTALTRTGGAFTLDQLPRGTYRILAGTGSGGAPPITCAVSGAVTMARSERIALPRVLKASRAPAAPGTLHGTAFPDANPFGRMELRGHQPGDLDMVVQQRWVLAPAFQTFTFQTLPGRYWLIPGEGGPDEHERAVVVAAGETKILDMKIF